MDSPKHISIIQIVFTFIYILIFPALFFIISGNWFWIEAWIFALWYTALCGSVIVYLYKNNPSLLSERYKKPGDGNQKRWDVFIVYAIMIGFIAWIVVMPFDAIRYHWSPSFPLYTKALGCILLIISYFFFFRAFTDNTYLSALVRVQSDRKQQVITTGIYAIVRHPMYLAAVCMYKVHVFCFDKQSSSKFLTCKFTPTISRFKYAQQSVKNQFHLNAL